MTRRKTTMPGESIITPIFISFVTIPAEQPTWVVPTKPPLVPNEPPKAEVAKYLMVPRLDKNLIRQSSDERAWLRGDIYRDLMTVIPPRAPVIIYDCGGINGTPIDGHPSGHRNSFDVWYFMDIYREVADMMINLFHWSNSYRFIAKTDCVRAIRKMYPRSKWADGYNGEVILVASDDQNHGHHWHCWKSK